MNWQFLITAIAGILAHLLAQYADSVQQKEQLNWKRSGSYAVIAVIIMAVFIININESSQLLGMQITGLTVFFIGYFSDSLIKNLSKYSPFKDRE